MIENIIYKEKYDRLVILYKDLEKEKNQLNETINEIISDFNLTNGKLEKENMCLKKEITNIKSEITYFFEKEQSNKYFHKFNTRKIQKLFRTIR